MSRPATILVADRNPRFLEKTAEILKSAGHDMIAASNGVTATARLSRELDGVLVHAALPGLSGFQLCRQVKERDPSLPVVIMFPAEDQKGELDARRSGADNWLVRPLKRLELLYVVRDMIALRTASLRAQRSLEERDQALRDTQMVPEDSRLVQFELFKRMLGIELKRSQRYGFPLSLLIAALDQSGTAHGKDLLAQATRTAIRDIDVPVSFGNSELLVMMPHTDLEGAQLVAERIRRRVRGPAGKAPTITASIGVVAAIGGERLSLATLLAQAQRALKTAKSDGGDRIEVAK